MIIKTKRDAKQWIDQLSEHNWHYKRILFELSEVTGDQYHTSHDGIKFYVNHKSISYDELVDILWKNRKLYNQQVRERNKLLAKLMCIYNGNLTQDEINELVTLVKQLMREEGEKA